MSLLTRAKDFIDQRLLPPGLLQDPYVVKRARLLMWMHVIVVLGSAAMTLLMSWVNPVNAMSFGFFTAIAAGLAALYQRQGNVVLSGNLLVLLVAAVLMESMLDTGGLYSDNLLWLLLVPIIAFLFTSHTWGLLWSVAVLGILVGLYIMELEAPISYRYKSLELGASYYFVSYLGLFAGVFGIILLFVRGNDDILTSLKSKSAALRAQKSFAEAQNEKLRKQEEALKLSNRDLELFAYVASHDLKEPLRMVNAYTQVLQRNLGPALEGKNAEYMGYVHQGAERMQTMLDDLLAYSRLGKERDAVQEVALNQSLMIVRNNLKSRIEECGGELLVPPLPTLSGKRTHFVQIFQNLTANALKFNRPGVPPRVRITTQRDAGEGYFVLGVEDNGIGIRAADLGSIFGVFQRLHAREDYEGSGIGLATVKRIVDGLGGRVEVNSTLGEGTTFRIFLPEALIVAWPENQAEVNSPTTAALVKDVG